MNSSAKTLFIGLDLDEISLRRSPVPSFAQKPHASFTSLFEQFSNPIKEKYIAVS